MLWVFLICKHGKPKTHWFTKVLLSHVFAVLKASRKCTCDRDQDKTSNFQDEDSKNGKFRDQISRLHHCLTCSGETNILCSKCNVHLCLNQWWSLETHFCKSRSPRFQVSSQSWRLSVLRLWILQRNSLVNFLKFNDFLFVVFAGEEQPKNARNKKNFNSEVIAIFKTKFWQNAQIVKVEIEVRMHRRPVLKVLK